MTVVLSVLYLRSRPNLRTTSADAKGWLGVVGKEIDFRRKQSRSFSSCDTDQKITWLASNWESFKSNNVSIRSLSWSYRDCWHQTCSQVDPLQMFQICTIPPVTILWLCAVICSVAASLCQRAQYGAICVPAANRGHGCRISGILSGIKP